MLHCASTTKVFKDLGYLVSGCLTVVEVGIESQSAVLYVEGEGVDVKVTGADDSDRFSVVHRPIAVQVHIRDLGGCVFIHASGRGESRGDTSVMSSK